MALHIFSKILYILTIILIFINTVNCEAYVEISTHPDYPGKCYFKGPPVTTLNIGEKRRLSQSCYKLECREGYMLYVAGCGVYGVNGHCRVIKGDLSRPYPDCCPELVC